MKKSILLLVIIFSFFSCSKNEETANGTPAPPAITNKVVTAGNYNFKYKVFYQEIQNATNRKGLIILAVGDGGNENDATLNEQCAALAQEGYVAVTTTYRSLDTGLTWDQQGAQFKQDMLFVASNTQIEYTGINQSNTILGGLSRGGNMTMALILPNQFAGTTPFTSIKGAILQCAGGDTWKGSAVQFPVAYMSNKVDNIMGVANANDFKTGLASNPNPNISSQSECLIYDSSGHCADISGNKAFIIKKVKEWIP
ncbi:MAG: hypothetical protein O9267_09365 [Flavobacterium sp.]|uniref:hypothetical protein n=1 Tax=Flavobacterium sp. TaxID=239 RepID=UPI0022C6B9A1|nr:hypothetical protein [Flavobacterium sp.]MCZ8197803.1 hypothetical protein [Flavobacterium sp.]